jgi:tetratricopeptide (TPR) repeat protein
MNRLSRAALGVLVLLAAVTFAVPAEAQTGGLRGKITDPKGQPVEGATVRIQAKAVARKLEVKTNRKGEYIQIGLFPGEYEILVEKGELKAVADIRVGLGDPTPLDMQLAPAGPSKEQAEQNVKVQAIFEEGVAANQAGNFEVAIAKFTEAASLVPNCHVCYFNIGASYARQAGSGDETLLTKAEENYKRAVEIKPDYAEGWNALAAVYNQQKRFDLAAEAGDKAAAAAGITPGGVAGGAGGNAPALYNQGVILWNQNKFAEAKDRFEAATKADPKYGEAFYRLGMAHMNLGDMAGAVEAFEGYLQAEPNGPHAAEVKGAIDALKPSIKK